MSGGGEGRYLARVESLAVLRVLGEIRLVEDFVFQLFSGLFAPMCGAAASESPGTAAQPSAIVVFQELNRLRSNAQQMVIRPSQELLEEHQGRLVHVILILLHAAFDRNCLC